MGVVLRRRRIEEDGNESSKMKWSESSCICELHCRTSHSLKLSREANFSGAMEIIMKQMTILPPTLSLHISLSLPSLVHSVCLPCLVNSSESERGERKNDGLVTQVLLSLWMVHGDTDCNNCNEWESLRIRFDCDSLSLPSLCFLTSDPGVG